MKSMSMKGPSAGEGMRQGNPILFDVLYLKEGRNADEAIAYFEEVSPIAARYGLAMIESYRINKSVRGTIAQPALINLWRMEKPDAMQRMGADPEYQKMTSTRDALFDMSKISLLMGEVACRCE